jgi:hypothetical protein
MFRGTPSVAGEARGKDMSWTVRKYDMAEFLQGGKVKETDVASFTCEQSARRFATQVKQDLVNEGLRSTPLPRHAVEAQVLERYSVQAVWVDSPAEGFEECARHNLRAAKASFARTAAAAQKALEHGNTEVAVRILRTFTVEPFAQALERG